MLNDTIVAISSGGKINQAISIIRMSGEDSIKIIQKIFTGKVGANQSITYGKIVWKGEVIDEVLVMWFIGKNNFTGENTVEINCHGGVLVTNRILELLLINGARMALPGEFSRRSFLNGKMDLVKAEAINDLIHSQTLEQAKISIKKFDGQTSKLIQNLINELSYLIGQIEVNIDYPEYDDVEQVLNKSLLEKLSNLNKKFETLIQNSENNRFIFEGIKTLIIGKPNVGKSSLLNCLLNDEKAIVTEQAGTTRDLIEGSYQLNGLLFKLIDSAGIRKTNKKIENIGIAKTFNEIQKSDLIIHLFDNKNIENDFDKKINELAKKYNKTVLKVKNKSDLLLKKDPNKYIYISAKNKDIEQLKQALSSLYKLPDINNDDFLTNTRQISLVKKAQQNIQEAIDSLNKGIDYDLVIIDIREAWVNLMDITGRADNEKLLDDMFSNFCLGK